jgi:DNA-binding MarR family transcriptional regulator
MVNYMSAPEIHTAIEALQQLADIFHERREQLAKEAGLTVQQWRVLEEISDEHFMPSMFAREQQSTAAAVSKIIRQLIDKGVIRVTVSEEDGRNRHYALTTVGRELMNRIRRSREKAISNVWQSFDVREVATFTDFSRRLHGKLQEYARGRNGK